MYFPSIDKTLPAIQFSEDNMLDVMRFICDHDTSDNTDYFSGRDDSGLYIMCFSDFDPDGYTFAKVSDWVVSVPHGIIVVDDKTMKRLHSKKYKNVTW